VTNVELQVPNRTEAGLLVYAEAEKVHHSSAAT
jgi:hypothetical protein